MRGVTAVMAWLLLTGPAADVFARQADATAPVRKPDTRTQVPDWLDGASFGLNVGLIDYPFSQAQLRPGFAARSIAVPRAAGSIVLFGHEISRHVSVHTSYIRAVKFVRYDDINDAKSSDSVWVVSAALTVRGRLPVRDRLALTGDIGAGMTNRRGFAHRDVPVIDDALAPALVLGAGLEYRLTPVWDAVTSVTFLSGRDRVQQPRTLFFSSGVKYTLRPLSAARAAPRADDHVVPEHVVRVEYAHQSAGFGANRLLSSKVPVFWGGRVGVGRGAALRYERNVFHTRRLLAVDLGASVAFWRSRDRNEAFGAISLYPVLRFTLVRADHADLFLSYSVAGPTFISAKVLDGEEIGTNRFTFQDMMGIGAFLGRDRRAMVGVFISHYSNGNLFARNAGVAVPLTFSLGYTF